MARWGEEETEKIEMWAPPRKYHTLKDGYAQRQYQRELAVRNEEKAERILRGYIELYKYVSDKGLSNTERGQIKKMIESDLI